MVNQHQSAGTFSPSVSGGKTRKRPSRRPPPAVQRHCGLSFWTFTEDSLGRQRTNCAFDVPLEEYGTGMYTGIDAAREFMAALCERKPFSPICVLIEVCAAMNEPLNDDPGRRGAAVGFLRTIENVLIKASGARGELTGCDRHFDLMLQAHPSKVRHG